MKKKLWVAAFLALALSAPAPGLSAQQCRVRVTAEHANIREKPDIGSAVLLQIPEGMILEAVSREGEWFLVRFTNESGLEARGYVHESLLLVVGDAPEKMKTRPDREGGAKPGETPPTRKEAGFRRPAKEPERKPSAAGTRPGGDRLVISVSTGGGLVSGGDINAGTRGLADYFEAVLGLSGQDTAAPAHLAYVLGVEAAVALNARLYIGAGVEYFKAQNESLVRYQPAGFSLRTRPRLSALPIHASLRFYPLNHFYVQGKIQYYLAGCGYYYHCEKVRFWEEWQGEAEGDGIGVELGVGAEWSLSANAAFFGEAGFRSAKVGNFSGMDKYLSTEGANSTERGDLYCYSGKASAAESYPLVFVREKKPSEAGVSDVRKAEIDYSGPLLKFGLRLKF